MNDSVAALDVVFIGLTTDYCNMIRLFESAEPGCETLYLEPTHKYPPERRSAIVAGIEAVCGSDGAKVFTATVSPQISRRVYPEMADVPCYELTIRWEAAGAAATNARK